MIGRGKALAAGALALLGLAWSVAAGAQPAELPAAVRALIPEAEKEGEALIWGTTLNPRQTQEIEDAFNRFYGTSVKLTHTGGPHGVKAVEVAEAYRKGIPTGVDVFWTAIPKALIDAEAVVPVDWSAEFGVDPALEMGDYGLETHHSNSTIVTVNTNLVSPDSYPTTYADLLDPRWKGKIAIPRSAFVWVMYAYPHGEEETKAYLTRLLEEQDVAMFPRYPDVMARVVAGEYAIGLGTDAFTEIKKGAPVAHAPMDRLIVNSSGAFIVADSPAKNIGKLWAYWAVSDDGQATLQRVRGYSLVTTKGSDLHEYARNKRVYTVPLDWRMENQDRLFATFAEIVKEAR